MGEEKRYSYPNAANNAPLAPPAYYQPGEVQPRRRRSPCCYCLATLCTVLIILFVAFGVAVLVVWLVVRPKLPQYDVTNVRISGLDSSLASGTLNTAVTFTFDTYNPNKKVGFYYDDFDIRVEALGVVVGKGKISPFYQGHRNRTIINSELKSDQITLPADTKTELLQAEADSKLPLRIRANVKTRLKIGSVKSRKIKVKVRCLVQVNPKLPGNQVISKECSVKK